MTITFKSRRLRFSFSCRFFNRQNFIVYSWSLWFIPKKSFKILYDVLLQLLLQQFWCRWTWKYITDLQTGMKWKRNSSQLLEIGNLVLVKADSLPPLAWKVGRIMVCIQDPGTDNVVRFASLRFSNRSTTKRSLFKFYVYYLWKRHNWYKMKRCWWRLQNHVL